MIMHGPKIDGEIKSTSNCLIVRLIDWLIMFCSCQVNHSRLIDWLIDWFHAVNGEIPGVKEMATYFWTVRGWKFPWIIFGKLLPERPCRVEPPQFWFRFVSRWRGRWRFRVSIGVFRGPWRDVGVSAWWFLGLFILNFAGSRGGLLFARIKFAKSFHGLTAFLVGVLR